MNMEVTVYDAIFQNCLVPIVKVPLSSLPPQTEETVLEMPLPILRTSLLPPPNSCPPNPPVPQPPHFLTPLQTVKVIRDRHSPEHPLVLQRSHVTPLVISTFQTCFSPLCRACKVWDFIRVDLGHLEDFENSVNK